MNRDEKTQIVDKLTTELNNYSHFYITDISELDAEKTSSLRRDCFEQDIKLLVVKNTLLKLALKNTGVEYDESLFETLKNSTSLMLSNSSSAPGKLIKEIRKKNEKPIIKAAYVEESVYIGDDQLETLASIKSKEELIGDIILLLQSPMKKVISSLNSGSNILTGVLETLSNKEN